MLNYTIMYSGATHLLTKRHKNLFIMIFLKSIPSYPKYKIWRSSGSYCLSLNTKDEMKRKGVLLPGKSITVQYDNFLPRFVPFFEQKIQGLFKDTFPIFQGLHSMQKKGLSVCLFSVLFDNKSNWKVFLHVCSFQVHENPGWTKLAPKFKDFPAATAIFKDFQGLEFSF